MDALCEAAKFVGKAFHPDVVILIQFDEVSEFKGVACLIVRHCTRKLLEVVFFHCYVQVEELKRVLVGCCKSLGKLVLWTVDVDGWNEAWADVAVGCIGHVLL